jgi:hypothetical protein
MFLPVTFCCLILEKTVYYNCKFTTGGAMNLRRIYAVIVVVLTVIVYSVAAQPTGLDSGRITRTLKLPDGATFVVTVSVGKWRSDPYKNAQLWGAWGGTAKTVTALVAASRNEDQLFVPFSSYADLANPHRAELRLKGSNVELEIEGAGRHGYRAVLVFAKGRYLTSRRVVDSEMPEDAREETKYFGVENR